MRFRFFLPILITAFACSEPVPRQHAASSSFAMAAITPFTDTTAAIFSQITYCPDPREKLSAFAPGWTVVWDPAPVGGTYAFVAAKENVFAVAIRGSLIAFTEDAFANWIYHDLNVASQDDWRYATTKTAKISSGAYLGWQNLCKMKDRSSGKTLWEYLSATVKSKHGWCLRGTASAETWRWYMLRICLFNLLKRAGNPA